MTQRTKIGGVIQNDRLASLSVLAMSDRPGIAAAVLDAVGRQGVNVQFVVQVIDHQNQDQMVLCVDRKDLPTSLDAIETIRPELQPAAVVSNPEVASVAIFGPDFRERPGIAAQMFSALAGRDINIIAISTSISTVTCIIELGQMKAALSALHAQFDLP